MSEFLVKNHIYHEGICAVGIMRGSYLFRFLLGVKGFALIS